MSGRIPAAFIDTLLARVDVVDVIEAYLPLRKTGRDFQALCPFHGEKTPSFTVSREKQFYHCFGCGAHGSAIGFLMQHRGLDFVEAIEELAGSVGLEVPREAGGSTRSGGDKELHAVLEAARAFYETQLRRSGSRARAVDYLKNRGLTGETAKSFHLGFAPDGWTNLYDHLRGNGIDDSLMERAGLISRRTHGGCYDRFRDRVMLPIHNRRGKVIGFGGRVIDNGEPKYLNSPETEVFHKGRELYGLHEALQHGAPARLLVVEGYMDVIALAQHGLHHAVATLGTAVTRQHLDLLFRQCPAVVFCFDGDAAGRRAARKALEISLPELAGDRQVSFAFLPDGHDPDSAVREFGSKALFTKTRNFGCADYLLSELRAEIDTSTAEGRTRLVAQAVPYLTQIPDEAHRAVGARLLAEQARLDEDLIRQQLGFKGRRSTATRQTPRGLARFARRSLEEQAISILVQTPALAPALTSDIAERLARELDSCALLLEVWKTARVGSPNSAALLERFREHEAEATINELAVLELPLSAEQREAEFGAAIERLISRADDAEIGRIRRIPFAQWTEAQKLRVRNHRRS